MLSFFAPPALVECGYTIPAAQLFCEAVGAWFALMFLVVVARNPFPTKNQFISGLMICQLAGEFHLSLSPSKFGVLRCARLVPSTVHPVSTLKMNTAASR